MGESIILTKALAFLKFISEEKIDEPAKWQGTVHKLVVSICNQHAKNMQKYSKIICTLCKKNMQKYAKMCKNVHILSQFM